MIREISLEALRELLTQMPLMVEMHPLTLAFLPEEVVVFERPQDLIAALDTPEPQPLRPMLTLEVDHSLVYRLPAFRCLHDPFTTELNTVLLKRYRLVRSLMLLQSQVSGEILQQIEGDVAILMLVDGLSFADYRRYAPQKWLTYGQPILVDGASVTDQGMLRIIGSPPLAYRLFDYGFRRFLGFTYWEREKDLLTDRLFTGFGDRVYKVRSLEQILEILELGDLKETFVQIVCAGTDQVAHRHRERPNVAHIVREFFQNVDTLVNLVQRKGLSGTLDIISDHGILWSYEHRLTEYEMSSSEHPRYYEHARQSDYVLNVEFERREFALLAYPYIRRPLRANEWGVHGGLSFEESVVPWIHYSISGGESHERRKSTHCL